MACKHEEYRELVKKGTMHTIESVVKWPTTVPHYKTILKQELRKRGLGS